MVCLLAAQARLSESAAPPAADSPKQHTCGHARVAEVQRQLFENDRDLQAQAAEGAEARRERLRGLARQASEAAGRAEAPGYPLEVQFDTSDLQASGKSSEVYNFLSRMLVPRIARYMSSLLRLKVPPNASISPFFVDCYAKRFSRGFSFNGGLGILLTADDYGEREPMYVAFSLVCKQDPVSRRPLLGQVNFNPAEIKLRHFDSVFETTLHEIFHILGFSPLLFPQFLDPHFMPIDFEASFLLDARGRIAGFKTPALLREAKAYYNCSTIEHLPLEDEGSAGSQYSHWERSVFADEVMTASSVVDSKVSVFTLALFEDSGWYFPNYTMKEQYTFLKSSECDMSTEEYACDSVAAQVCTYNRRTQGYCSRDTFNNGLLKRGANQYGRCTSPKPASHKTRFHQAFMGASFCFEANLTQREGKVQVALEGPACFEAVCYHNDGKARVRLKINNLYYECVDDHQVLRLQLQDMEGTIACPNIRLFCLNDQPCEDRCTLQGRCLDDGSCFNYD